MLGPVQMLILGFENPNFKGEALAEKLHQEARAAWGYGKDERLAVPELIRERYRGIRPAPGYPAQPDHSEKRTVFELLGAERATRGLAAPEHIPHARVERGALLETAPHARPGALALREELSDVISEIVNIKKFVLNAAEQQAVVVLEDGQHRLAADRRPASEDHRHLVLQEQLLGLLGEEVPVGRGIDHLRLHLPAHDAARLIDFLHGHQHDIAQGHFADRHGAAQ